MQPSQTILSIVTILDFLLFIPGLWIAGILLPTILAWVPSARLREFFSRGPARFVLWLALGWLFAAPMADILGWLYNWIALVFPAPGQFGSAWGTAPGAVYSITSILIIGGVYAVVLWLTRSLWLHAGQPLRIERLFPILGMSHLVLQIIQVPASQLQNIQIPFPALQQNLGVPGFILGWVIGLVLFAIVAAILDGAVEKYVDRRSPGPQG